MDHSICVEMVTLCAVARTTIITPKGTKGSANQPGAPPTPRPPHLTNRPASPQLETIARRFQNLLETLLKKLNSAIAVVCAYVYCVGSQSKFFRIFRFPGHFG
jgi:hypothetical protein